MSERKAITIEEAIETAKDMENPVIVHSDKDTLDVGEIKTYSSCFLNKGFAYLMDGENLFYNDAKSSMNLRQL